MDYEKAYKKALETARDFLDFYKDNPVQAQKFIDIFPELAESEDERVRSVIKKILLGVRNEVFIQEGFAKDTVLAWLEKQKDSFENGRQLGIMQEQARLELGWPEPKEQKPTDDKAFEEWINDWWKHNKVNNPDSYDKGDEIQFDERGFKNFCRGIRNMYAEQKPSDLPAGFYYIDGKGNKYYSKEVRCKNESGGYVSMKVTDKEPKPIPKFKVGDRIYDRRDSYNRNVIREVGKDYYINAFAQKMDMAYTDANFEFLEHLDNDLIDSKPAEWSKNDTVFLNEITDFFENKTVRLQHDLDMYAHWLKSLPERFVLEPKQEWSEEDERLLNIIIDILDKEEHNGHLSHEDLISSVKLIKSLRPSWKPSEEQMEALQYFLKFHQRGYEASTHGWKEYTDLKSLYEQLKCNR